MVCIYIYNYYFLNIYIYIIIISIVNNYYYYYYIYICIYIYMYAVPNKQLHPSASRWKRPWNTALWHRKAVLVFCHLPGVRTRSPRGQIPWPISQPFCKITGGYVLKSSLNNPRQPFKK